MYNLTRYLKEYKKECWFAPLFKMLEALFELTVPLVIAYMIDDGIKKDSSRVIALSFFILILLAAVGLAVSCTAQYFAAKAATGFSKGLRHDLFAHILTFGFSEVDNVGTSTLITRMTSDVNILQNGVNMFLRLFLRSPFIVIGAMVMAFTIDAKSALTFVAVIFALSVFVYLVTATNIPLLKSAQKKLDDVLCLVRENLSGARVIRAFTREDESVDSFMHTNSDLTKLQLAAGKISGLLNPVTYVMINLAIACLIYIGNRRVAAGAITTGMVVALYNYMSQILIELIKFANLIVTMNRSLASAARVNEIFDIRPSMTDAHDGKEIEVKEDVPIVEFKDVSLRYHEDADEAVSNISFKLMPSETLGIIGGTGAGKSTVASLMARFYDASSGEVLIAGKNIKDIDISKLRRFVGVIMQTAVLFEGSIRDNMKWGCKDASDEEILEAIEAAVCSEVVKEKGGLDAMIEAGGRNLSGGQRQRLSIARVLTARPRVLILDDSASALDYLTDKKLRENISKLSYDPAVVIIAQRTISVEDCDNILVLDDGEAVGFGPHEKLLKTCETYREIYASQHEDMKAEDE